METHRSPVARWILAGITARRAALTSLIGATLIGLALAAPASAQQSSLTFSSASSQYVTFGSAAGETQLGARSFTLECWIKRTGPGTTASTGTGGVTAVPLVTKGRGEAENSNVDCNYFLGIDASNHLVADFEEGSGQVAPGQNRPVTGTATLALNVWYHVAATYDHLTGTWTLYVNGVVDAAPPALGANHAPRWDSIQHAGLGTAMNSTGVTQGFFTGVMDEPRIWNVARTQTQIQASMNSELTSGTGLIGRWGLDEGSGTTAANSIVTSPLTPGTLTNGPLWTAATVFAAPAAPAGLTATFVSATQNQLAWTDNSSNETSFEIERSTTGSGGPYTPLATVGQNVVSYTDNAVPAGPPSCYRVRAVDPGGASGYATPACAAAPSPPADPTGLTATQVSTSRIDLAWVDQANNETGYEVWLSTTGIGGTYSLLTTLAANTQSYSHTGLTPGSEYCYQVRAVNGVGPSGYAGPSCASTTPGGIDFGPTNTTTYVTFPNASAPHLTQFTIEAWIRRDGAGVGNTTGGGGITSAVPLVAKGMAEAETQAADINYFLGIDASTGRLCADFEEAQGGTSPSLNHPVFGTNTTALQPNTGTWHHVAVTYDGNAWTLYLDGVVDGQLTVGRPCNSANTSPASIATAQKTDGAPLGFFDGAVDEVRIWNYARSQADIQCAINGAITTPTTGLVARWSLDEGTGSAVNGSAGTAVNGTITGANYGWVGPAPFNLAVTPPTPSDPSSLSAVAISETRVDLGWTDNATDESNYEVVRSTAGSGGPYTLLVTLPAGATSYSNTGLTAGAEYCYQVRAITACTQSGYTAFACATTPAPPPPADPTGLTVTVLSNTRLDLAWTDNASNETAYEVERSTTGSGGPYTPLTTLPAGSTSYSNTGLSASTEYCYRVRAMNGGTPSSYAGPACATTAAGAALDLAGSTYVAFGNPPAVGLATFTLETWFRRDGTGTVASTGAGGVSAIPLIAKALHETDGSNVDGNYFLGIDGATARIAADFEDMATGLNHPVYTTTTVTAGWHHVAATYDGTTWRLYLDGNLETTLLVNQTPRSDSQQRLGLGTAFNSTGTAEGAFDGALDEVRIWNYARSQAEILATVNSQITTPTTGLVARWGLDEGDGTAVNGSAGTAVNGTITGANYSWILPAPFDIAPPSPPADPSNLGVSACSQVHVDLSWNDNSSDETGFQIERGPSPGGPFTPLVTTAANVTSYSDFTVSPATQYCYRVRAAKGGTPSNYAGPECATTPVTGANALDLGGTNAYANFGNAPALSLSAFTIEMWVRRDATGGGTTTGTAGISSAVPLFAKGRAEAETQAADINYIFAISDSTGGLCADFEEAQSGANPGLNHPIYGATPLALGTWYHVAATYDGLSWKLYLNGTLDASLDIGQPVNNQNTAAASLGSALRTDGSAAGFFNGVVDEVRVWNYAREQSQIQFTANAQIAAPQTGLVARWSMDEGTGAAVNGSAGTSINGTLTGTYAWGCGSDAAPFDLAFNNPPQVPALVSPADGGTGVSTAPSLDVAVTDPEGGNLTVTYYARATNGSPAPDFTLIGLPDTQYYTGQLNGGTSAMFDAQTTWIAANRLARNIAYVAHLGDCTEHGNSAPVEWSRAVGSLSLLEPDGIPYGVCAGNHDQTPIGDADSPNSTDLYNANFGIARFSGRPYYGGHYGTNNDNWYDLFSAGGMDFIVISLEYDTSPDAAVLTWADGLLTTYASRRAIVASHFIANTGNPGGFGPQGQAIYNALKGHSNLFLMLCGHVPGEGRRQDTFNGNTVHTLLSDYQGRANGGDGWLRILEFSPANNVIRVRTYSPTLGQFEADADSSSQFTLPYTMTTTPQFQAIGTVSGVPSGSTSSFVWSGRTPGTTYEWYATVSDGGGTTTGPVWSFTTAATAPLALTETHVDEQCNGQSVGSIDLTVSGGTAPYTYLWSDGPTTEDRTGLAAGTYTVTVTDANNATANLPVTITQPAQLLASALATHVACFGGTTGAVDLTVNGGTSPYTYLWSNSATGEDLSGLIAGSYSVTVTDANGCTANASATVTEPAALVVSETHTETCVGSPDGTIDLSVTGGTAPYGYAWSNAATSEDLGGLTAGSYSVTVTDAHGCTAATSATIAVRQYAITATSGTGGAISPPGVTTLDCGTDQAYTITADAGYHVLDVVLDGATSLGPVTSYTFSGVVADRAIAAAFAPDDAAATVAVGTPSGALTECSPTVTVPVTISRVATTPIKAVSVSVQLSAELAASGGTAAFTDGGFMPNPAFNVIDHGGGLYTVDNAVLGSSPCGSSGTSGTLFSILLTNTGPSSPGTVTITEVKLRDCANQPLASVASGPGSVTIVAPMTLSETHSNVACYGASTGAVDLTVGGGTSPYTYLWSNGAITEDLSGLMAGSYSVTVTDANGCTANASATVTEPTQLLASAVATNVACFGGTTGVVDLTVGGGTPPYSYLWSNGATTEDLTGLTAGSYSVTVTDANGCTANASATVTEPAAALLASAVATNVACFGGTTGVVDLTVGGGTPPYSYLWSNAATTEDLTGLTAGSYSVTVTDANGCTANASATVIEPAAALAASAVATPVACFGGTTGAIDLTVSGGTSPYTYLWSNAATTEDLAGLTAGSYSVTVTDANGCTANVSATVTEPAAALLASAVATNVACFGGTTGAVDLTVSGGTPPYSYLWSNSATSEDLSGLMAGSYSVTVTDANGCTANASATVTEPAAALLASAVATNVACFGGTTGAVDLTVGGGTPPYSYLWSNAATTEDLAGLTAGSYSVTVTDANGCTANASATVTEPAAALLASAVATNVACFGGTTGAVDLTVSGGTSPYSYLWSNAATTEDLAGLSAGSYSVTVTDANGCTANASATVTEPAALALSETHTPTCLGAPDGSVDLTASGGASPYTYAWSNGGTTEDLSGLVAGTYSVTVTDANGCTAGTSATIVLRTYLVTASAGSGGTINPSGSVSVDCGADQTFTISANPGYQILDVLMDGGSVGAVASHTLTNVTGPHTVSATFVTTESALQFNGVDQAVTFGPAPSLGASRFTLELWFKKTGAGVTTNTGTGGILAVPLLTKGRGEVDQGDSRDMNYFLGLDASGHVVADYEEGSTQLAPSLNHPVIGGTVVTSNVWYHAAAVFDGTSFRLYLNGVLDGVTNGLLGRDPAANSIQHAGLGTAYTSDGTAGGFFAGEIDEARVWGLARTQCDIIAAMNAEVVAGTGLLGRWGLDEGTGSTAGNSIGGGPVGSLVSAPAWVAGAPFDLTPPAVSPPDAPSGLSATAPDGYRVQLAWVDASASEEAFQIERSTAGTEGPFFPVATLGPDVTSYLDAPLVPQTEYCYRVRAVNCVAHSAYAEAACATTATDLCNALDVTPAGGTAGGYVRVGNHVPLQLSSFTLELWIRRDGTGIATSTGSGGILDAVPLISKGRAEDDTPANNVNYLMGIRQSDGVLCADFEEGPAGATPGAAHPVVGTTPIPPGVWHHVAATYDGATWVLYLDGNVEATLAVNRPACDVSTVGVALASTLNSTGAAAGYFDGAIDEVRIWNVARTQLEIQTARHQSLSMPTPGLVGRWALDEAFGTTAFGTAGTGIHGTIVGTPATNWDRVACGSWVTAVGDGEIAEISFAKVVPNPTHGRTQFEFALPGVAHVSLEIHDVLGRRVAVVANQEFPAGRHRLGWSGRRDGGGQVPAGIYFVRFRAGDRTTTRTFVLVR